MRWACKQLWGAFSSFLIPAGQISSQGTWFLWYKKAGWVSSLHDLREVFPHQVPQFPDLRSLILPLISWWLFLSVERLAWAFSNTQYPPYWEPRWLNYLIRISSQIYSNKQPFLLKDNLHIPKFSFLHVSQAWSLILHSSPCGSILFSIVL